MRFHSLQIRFHSLDRLGLLDGDSVIRLSWHVTIRVVDSLLEFGVHQPGFRVHRLGFMVLRLECMVHRLELEGHARSDGW